MVAMRSDTGFDCAVWGSRKNQSDSVLLLLIVATLSSNYGNVVQWFRQKWRLPV